MSTDAQTPVVTSRRLWRLLAVLGILLPTLPAAAVTFPDLYTVTVAVDSTVPNRRAAAVRQGMAILLTRVTGRPQAAGYPELMPLLESAPRLVTSYGEVDSERARVGFNGAAVQSQLTALDWPLWGADRPQVALWAAVDFGDGQRSVIAAESGAFAGDSPSLSAAQAEFRDGLRDELVRAADERGLPLRLPLMDETDYRYASFAAVWGGFAGVLATASERYAADFILIARFALTDLGLEVDWQLVGADGARRALRSSSAREGIDWVADLFAAQFSSAGGLREMQIDIEGITSLDDYGRVMRYLGTVSMIETLDVAAYSGEVLGLRAAVRGDAAVLDRVFRLGGVLEPAAPDATVAPGPGAADLPDFPGFPGLAGRYSLVEAGASLR